MLKKRWELYNKEICSCSIFGAMNREGERFKGKNVVEAAIRLISPKLDRVWTPNGGEPVVGQLNSKRVVRDEVIPVS